MMEPITYSDGLNVERWKPLSINGNTFVPSHENKSDVRAYRMLWAMDGEVKGDRPMLVVQIRKEEMAADISLNLAAAERKLDQFMSNRGFKRAS